MSLFEELRAAIASTLDIPIEDVTETSAAGELAAWDSLGQVNVMMTIEQNYGLMLDAEEIANLNSVPLILEYLQSKGITAG